MPVHPEMPLATHQCGVACRLQNLGNRHAVLVEDPPVIRKVWARIVIKRSGRIRHMANPSFVGMEPSHQRSTCGTTASTVVELLETQAILGKSIDVRRFNLTSVTTEIRVPHVVCEDDDDIGAFFRYQIGETDESN